MIGATKNSSGITGFVPGPEANEHTLFLRGDGTWAAPEVDHTVLTLENTNGKTHKDLISEVSIPSISGDIIIIKDLIANDKYQYSAYVYDNYEWHAMDGNYDAENVYFSEDLITTSAIGNIELDENGQAVIAAAGKNLKEVFETIFVQEKDPVITNPEINLIFTQGNKEYEVGTKVEPQYSATLIPGDYEFGPATGIVASQWSITDNEGQVQNVASGKMPEITIKDNMSYRITAVASYNSGTVPMTNLKNLKDSLQIKAGSATAVSAAMKGFRCSFYGTLDNKNELTSEIIRSNLTPSTSAFYNGKETIVNIPLEAMRVVFAYPVSLGDLKSVKDSNGLSAEILNSFTKINLDIEGNNGYEAIEYNVYYIDYANPNDKTTG